MAETVRIEGLRELLRRTDAAGKETKKLVRGELRKAAEPVKTESRRLLYPIDVRSASKIGISVRKVGTVTVEQRLKKSPVVARRRPNFVGLSMRRALIPALQHKSDEVVASLAESVDRINERWGQGG